MQAQGDSRVTLGVLSDTHRRVDLTQFCLETLKAEGAEFLIHAGDIVEREILDLLESSGLPYVAVLGNNDTHLQELMPHYSLVHEPYTFTHQGLHVKLMHHPFYLAPADADLVVYGHTHFFEASYTNGTFFLNPGEVCARKKEACECVLLHVNLPYWDVTRFTCKPKKRVWEKEYWSFR